MKTKMMICPKCGLKQRKCPECSKCGVNVDRFLEELKKEALELEGPLLKKNKKPKEPVPQKPQMVCPSCGVRQAKAHDCVACGADVECFLAEMMEEALAPDIEETVEESPREEAATPMGKKTLMFLEEAGIDGKKYKRAISKWYRKLVYLLLETALFFTVAWLFFAGLLYVSGILWRLYIETHIGQTYLIHFRDDAQVLFDLTGRDPLMFSLELTAVSIAVCLAVGAVCRLCFLTRIFFDASGFFQRNLVWGPILAILCSLAIKTVLGTEWIYAFVLAIVPAFFQFGVCMRLTGHMLPELDIAAFFEKIISFLRAEKLRNACRQFLGRSDKGKT